MTAKINAYSSKNDAAEQLELYKLLVDSVQDYAIFWLDTRGHVASWNTGAERLKGYDAKDIIGTHFSVFFTEKDNAARKPETELLHAKQYGTYEAEGWRVRKDDTKFWANVIITALYDKKRKLRGFAKITRDLTRRKHNEDKLRQINLQLKHQQQTLTSLNKAKDEFVSLASHQLRTPATGVKQYLGMLLQGFVGGLDERQEDIIQKAYDSNNRQIEIVNDLLKVAQVDAGKIELQKEPVVIVELIEDIVDEQSEAIKDRQQHLTINKPDEPVRLLADSERLRMALENLVDNASKYTPQKGKITISIKASKKDVQIKVADTGVGIKAEDMVQLFQKFSRISNELSLKVSGSGLGLYWTKKIINLHGGKIKVRSKVGEGTEFLVILPCGDQDV